jgi:hypothetical protein
MSTRQAMPINSDLVETLIQIIWSLNEQERQLLLRQLQDPNLTDVHLIGVQQILDGEYIDYTDETLPELMPKI